MQEQLKNTKKARAVMNYTLRIEPLLAALGLFFLANSAQALIVLEGAPGTPGELGDFNPTANTTVQLPDDGILHYSSVNVPSGVTVTFAKPASGLNPAVHILSMGDIIVTGAISVDGKDGNTVAPGEGGPGGFDGGAPPFNAPAGAGHGPGAGTLASPNAAYGRDNGTVLAYGSPLVVPLVGGSGGAGLTTYHKCGGGGGGGAILLASETRIQITGSISARGGGMQSNMYWGASGSGGAIRLVAPTVTGTGYLRVESIHDNNIASIAGRVRIDAFDKTGIAFNFGNAVKTVGGFMSAIPPNLPKLELIEVAGQSVVGDQYFRYTLPFGSDPSQVIRLRASNFGVPPSNVSVVLSPYEGDSTSYSAVFDQGTGPYEADVSVVFPANMPTEIHVWAEVTP